MGELISREIKNIDRIEIYMYNHLHANNVLTCYRIDLFRIKFYLTCIEYLVAVREVAQNPYNLVPWDKKKSEYSDFQIREKIGQGRDGKINGDNLDIYIFANQWHSSEKQK